MPAIISEKFRIFNAKQFIESFTEGSGESDTARTRMYFFVGRPQRWDAYLEIYSQNATAFNVGDEVFVGANYGSSTFRAKVRQVFAESLLLYDVNGAAGISSTPSVGSTLLGYSGGVNTGAQAVTGVYRYATDEIPPQPLDNQTEKYAVYDDLISAKRISSDYVRTVVTRYNWIAGTIYDMWKPDYSGVSTGRTGKTAANGAPSISSAKYYVMNSSYQVWSCVQNSNGSQSTEEPSITPSVGTYNSSTGLFRESTGTYVWKYMYTIPTDDVMRFLTTDFMPIVLPTEATRANVLATQVVDGAIDAYVIEDEGTGLTNGTYYAPVVGDGSGAIAVITVSGNVITFVETYSTNRGSGYTYGSVTFATGTGSGATANGLFGNPTLTTPANPGGQANIEVVIPPQGGYGADMELELNGKRVLTNIRLASNEGSGDFPVDNDFRRIGIIQDPTSNGSLAIADTLNGLTALKITGAGADYIVDEVVTQDLGGGLTAKGTVVSWEPDTVGSFNGVLKIFQSTEYHKDNGVVRAFDSSLAATVDGTNSVTAGTIDNTYNAASGPSLFGTFTNGISLPEIDNNSGDVIYIENRRLITRAPDQIEDIKLVIEF